MCSSVQAQELYFRNKPFKGPRTGSWEQVMVGIKETAAIFELSVAEQNGAYLVGESTQTDATSGQVWVNGKLIASAPGETGPLVNLKELAAAAELAYKPNKEMGGIDVHYTEGEPNYVNRDNPGVDAGRPSSARWRVSSHASGHLHPVLHRPHAPALFAQGADP